MEENGQKRRFSTFIILCVCVYMCVFMSKAAEQNREDSHLFTPEEERELRNIEAG